MALKMQVPVSWAKERWHSARCEPREQPCRWYSLVGGNQEWCEWGLLWCGVARPVRVVCVCVLGGGGSGGGFGLCSTNPHASLLVPVLTGGVV